MPEPSSPPPAAARDPGDDGQTILICEDETPLRELVRAVLGPEYRYVEAVDGEEALEFLKTASPDLVVLDLMLPRVSGFDVLRELREDPSSKQVPVVVLTAWAYAEGEAEAHGADRFVPKPFEPRELAAVVKELLER
jgi:DNA-binding response OmpR family regulator